MTNSAGKLIAQSHSNRLHRKCQGGKELKSCSVKVGQERLLNCKKALERFPDIKNNILESRASKAEAKDPHTLLVKRQYEQSLLGTIPLPKAREAAAIKVALLDTPVISNVMCYDLGLLILAFH